MENDSPLFGMDTYGYNNPSTMVTGTISPGTLLSKGTHATDFSSDFLDVPEKSPDFATSLSPENR